MSPHKCTCGHDHEGQCQVKVGKSDLQPVTVGRSKEYEVNGGSHEEIRKRYELILLNIEKWCGRQDAMIGHLKLTLTTGCAVLMLSCTGNGVQQSGDTDFLGRESQHYNMNLAAIVYGVEENKLSGFIDHQLEVFKEFSEFEKKNLKKS